MPKGLGFDVRSNTNIRKDAWLFGEAQSRVVVSVRTSQSAEFERFLQSENISFEQMGQVKGDAVVIDGENWGAVTDWKRTYETVLSDIMNGEM
jgi:phosphoribosylformylglycinamidine synthase